MVHKVRLGIYPRKLAPTSSHAIVNGYRISDLELARIDVVYFARCCVLSYRDGRSRGLMLSKFQEAILRRLSREADARARPGRQVGDVGLDVGSS